MTGNRPSDEMEVERLTAELANAKRAYHEVLDGYQSFKAEHERLTAVAVAAKALVDEPTGRDYYEDDLCAFPEPLVTALETALEAAGYGMTEEEFHARL